MDIRELAGAYYGMVANGQMDEAARTYWADNIATYEAMPGDYAETHGREQAFAKQQWWNDNHEVHGLETKGPYVHGDQFLIWMAIDVTPKGGERMQMAEVVQYKVADGKVVEERYWY